MKSIQGDIIYYDKYLIYNNYLNLSKCFIIKLIIAKNGISIYNFSLYKRY